MSWPDRASDPPVRSASIPTGTATWTEEGDGPTVVAIHGLPGSRYDFRWLAPALPDFRWIRTEQPGFGDAPTGRVGPEVGDLIAHLSEVLDAAQVQQAVLVAHSFGAAVAAHLAEALGARVQGLALLAPAGLRPHSLLRHQRTVRTLGAIARAPGIGTALGQLLVPPYRALGFRRASAAEARRTFAVVGCWDWAGTRAVADRLRVHGLPALVALAEDDPIVEPSRSRLWAEHLGVAPVVWASGGHSIQKTRALEFAAAFRSWHGQLASS